MKKSYALMICLLLAPLINAMDEDHNARQQVADVLNSSSDDPRLQQAEDHFKRSRYHQACKQYEEAFADGKGSAGDHVNYGESLLGNGDYINGFAEREARLAGMPPLQKPYDGNNPAGKTFLIRCQGDGGLGDTGFFAYRYGPILKKLDTHIILVSQRPLKKLSEYQEFADEVITANDPVPAFDYDMYQMSLPHFLSSVGLEPTSEKTIPSAPYMKVPEPIVQEWKEKMDKIDGGKAFRVGFVYRASPLPGGVLRRYQRDIMLVRLMAAILSASKWIQLYDLQGPGHRAVPGQEFMELSDQRNLGTLDYKDLVDDGMPTPYKVEDAHGAFVDMVAAAKNCDAVVSVDTAGLNFAAASGANTHGLLPKECDWRWRTQEQCGNKSPWFNSLKLHWQETEGDWTPALDSLTQSLKQEAAAREKRSWWPW